MSRRRVIKKDEKKFRVSDVIDWLQENRSNKKMCRWCGDNPPMTDSDYCSEACVKSGSAVRFSDDS